MQGKDTARKDDARKGQCKERIIQGKEMQGKENARIGQSKDRQCKERTVQGKGNASNSRGFGSITY